MAIDTDHLTGTNWSLPETLREFLDSGDGDMVIEILMLFQDDAATRLRDLNQFLADGNRDGVRRQAHTLKGASMQVGAEAMGALCRELELRANTASTAELLDLVCRTQESYDRTCKEMLPAVKG